MTETKLPDFLLDAFDDLDRVLHNLSPEDAVRHVDGSSFGDYPGLLSHSIPRP